MLKQEKQAIKEELKQPYAFHTKREDYEKYGYSRGCPGCRALLTGTTKQKHTPQCRQRMEKEMGELERVNPADVLTKPMSFSEMLGKLGRVHLSSDLGLQSQVEGSVDIT